MTIKVSLESENTFLTSGMKGFESNQFPELKIVSPSQGIYAIAITDVSIERLDRLNVEWSDEAKLIRDGVLMRRTAHELAAANTANFKLNGSVPDHDLELHPDFTLSSYQQVAAVNMHMLEAYSLFMEQGTGKTPIVIADICNSAKKLEDNRVFLSTIICPNSVRMNWQKELEKFTTIDLDVTVLRGGKFKKIDQLTEAVGSRKQASVVVMGYDTVRSIWDALQFVPWDSGYADESHYIKGPKTKRTTYLHYLRNNTAKRGILTGTPIANTHNDLWGQLEFLGQGYSGFMTFDGFKKFYGTYDRSKGRDGIQKLVGVQNMPFMKKRLANYSIQFTKEEVLPYLPKKSYDIFEIEMSKQQAEVYKQVANDLMTEIDEKELTVNNILTMMLRLGQITSGYVKFDKVVSDEGVVLDRGEVKYFDENPKVEALKQILSEKTTKQKTIIWACGRPEIFKLIEELGDSAVSYFGDTNEHDREEAVRRFNDDPTCTIFIGNPSCSGAGLNLLGYNHEDPEDQWLDTNCDHMIYYSMNWSMVHRQQSEARPHRRGTRVPIRITDLCVPMTIDETIRARVVEKKMDAMEISDIRDILKEIADACA